MNWLHRWRAVWNPDMYHGWGREKRYFEGWYFKIVSADEQAALAIIPGISMDKRGNSHAFIQIMDGIAHTSKYYWFKPEAFTPAPTHFALQLDANHFSAEKIELDLPELLGKIQFENTTPWPSMLGAPGIMGWYSFVPFMECFHGVVSLHHRLNGHLEWNGRNIDFTNGIGYIEKDWGRSFPRAYVWMQTNHFQGSPPVSLMASVAHIPWLTGAFIGFISGFWLDGRLFRFATYTGAKHHLRLTSESVELSFKSPKTELCILAKQAPGTALAAPISGEMSGKINESLQANILAELFENGHRIFEGAAQTAGLEVAGATELLLK